MTIISISCVPRFYYKINYWVVWIFLVKDLWVFFCIGYYELINVGMLTRLSMHWLKQTGFFFFPILLTLTTWSDYICVCITIPQTNTSLNALLGLVFWGMPDFFVSLKDIGYYVNLTLNSSWRKVYMNS